MTHPIRKWPRPPGVPPTSPKERASIVGEYQTLRSEFRENVQSPIPRKRVSENELLEDEGLTIDPAFTPELMVLAGLIPIYFSVRTPKGERIYREIAINAPMWSLNIAREQENHRPFTNIEFHFRRIEIVRKAITATATQYLESEASLRR